ncbi:MAG: class F sortase [Candidatus Spechtbacterales bacterium]
MKTFSRKRLLVIIAAGFAFGCLFFIYSIGNLHEKLISLISIQDDEVLLAENTADPYHQEQAKSKLPVRLKIPGIEVDVAIEYVGVTPAGAMDVPKDRDNVAWFSLGTRPGENGSAVIAGHSGYRAGKVAFDDLNTLRKGDKLYVEDALGKSVSFVVRESRVYDAGAYVPEVFTSDTGIHLNLVTCVGVWDESTKRYSKRLVVFTDSIE